MARDGYFACFIGLYWPAIAAATTPTGPVVVHDLPALSGCPAAEVGLGISGADLAPRQTQKFASGSRRARKIATTRAFAWRMREVNRQHRTRASTAAIPHLKPTNEWSNTRIETAATTQRAVSNTRLTRQKMRRTRRMRGAHHPRGVRQPTRASYDPAHPHTRFSLSGGTKRGQDGPSSLQIRAASPVEAAPVPRPAVGKHMSRPQRSRGARTGPHTHKHALGRGARLT